MPRWRRLFSILPRSRSQLTADVDDELGFHLEMRVQDLVARGVSPGAARAEAMRTFGDVGTVRNACLVIDERRSRRVHRNEVLHFMWQDIRFAGRALRKSPGFTSAAVLCIGLGIGVTTTIFSAIDAILIRPLPYASADRLVAIYSGNNDMDAHGVNISYPDYVSWRDESRSFDTIGIWTWTTHALSGACGSSACEAERVDGAAVSPNLFPMLGVRPLYGRTFVSGEDRPGADRVLLLSYGVFQQRFASDPTVIGRTTLVDGVPYTVVGVMRRGFNFPERGKVWVPFTPQANEGRGNRGYAGAIARLRTGVTIAQARADLGALSSRLQREFPNESFGWYAEVKSLREDLTGDLRKPLLVFLGAVSFVLLIACANVANLMLARGATRQREIAMRIALGAGRGRVARQILTESGLLAIVGALLGIGLALAGVRLMRLAFPDEVPFYMALGLDGTAAAFAVALAALTAVLFGMAPALRAGDVDLNTFLRDGARASGGLARSRLRSALIVAEVALSLILMIGAGLLMRSYQALQGTELGFQQRGVLSLRLSLPATKYGQAAQRLAFYDQLLTRVRSLPGVETVGSAQGIPFSGWDLQAEMTVEGRAAQRRGEELVAHFQWVTPDYFKAIGVPLVRGRWLTAADRDTVAPVALINQLFAHRAFPNTDPIGKRIKFGDAASRDPWVTVVGVIGDFRHYRLPQPMGPAIYYSYASHPTLTQALAIRTTLEDPLTLVPAIRGMVRDLDPDVPAYQVRTFEQQVGRSLWRQRLQSQVLGVFATLALLLASVGLYGVISYAVAQRTRELGVRVALGATARDVVRLVLGQGLRLTIVGIVVGLLGAFALTRVVRSLLHGVDATDPLTFVAVPIVLTLVALVASYVPARRATHVDPLLAMRTE